MVQDTHVAVRDPVLPAAHADLHAIDITESGQVLLQALPTSLPAARGNTLHVPASTRRSLQLFELTPAGVVQQLTATGTHCTGRYVPGRRTVVVEHDWGVGSASQLSLLNLVATYLPAGLEGLHLLAHGAGITHRLLQVHSRGVLYLSDERKRGVMDLWWRDWVLGCRPLAQDLPIDLQASCTPDGRMCVTFSRVDNCVALVCLETSQIARYQLTTRIPITSATVTPDGRSAHVTYCDHLEHGTLVFSPDEGLRDMPSPGHVITGGFCPDGTYTVILDHAGPQIRILDAAGGEVMAWRLPPNHRHTSNAECMARGYAVWSPHSHQVVIDACQRAWRVELPERRLTTLW